MNANFKPRRRDETVELRRVGVGGVYWALVYSGLNSVSVTKCLYVLLKGQRASQYDT